MRHGKKIHKLERPREHRQALISNLASALITHRKIKTTEAKAKALKPVIDRLIRTAKTNTVHARRLAAKTIKRRETLKKLFDEIAPEMLERTSGYSRIMRVGARKGDGAQLVLVELLMTESESEDKPKKGRKGWRKFGRKGKGEKKPAKSKRAPVPAEEETVEAAAEEDVVHDAVEETPPEDEPLQSEQPEPSAEKKPADEDEAETDSERKDSE